ncbi:squalene/phytoene synthase family protein [Corynebacterium sp.]|uniref:squalene/phytoene synthase family protein n=1 Tax=Corynebacterium sp. TaxID=1720 RepID=UPI003B3AFD9D
MNTRSPRRGPRRRARHRSTAADMYAALAERVSATVIGRYSTSFSLATRLLPAGVREDVRNLYAVVRIADEIVDGAATGHPDPRAVLDSYEDRVLEAADEGFHTDLVLHAWAATAVRCRIDPAHMTAFFASMRSDIDRAVHDEESLARYIYGSAEVIGLMCLDIFLAHGGQVPAAQRAWLGEGAAALGAAFQKVNFLRDLGDDQDSLGRTYLPELQDGPLTAQARDRILDDVDAGIAAGRERVPSLPAGCRAGVSAAAALYEELSARLRRTPPAQLRQTRVRVPAPVKVVLTTREVAREVVGEVVREVVRGTVRGRR